MSSKDPFPLLPSLALQKLGKRVAMARRARGLNQRDLAHLAGVGPSSIVALEAGHPGVAIGTLARALEAMDLLAEMDEVLLPERDAAVTAFAVNQLGGAPR